jgi:exosortase/archaeosortase family protein
MFNIKQIIEEHKGFISLIIKSIIFLAVISVLFNWLPRVFDEFYPKSWAVAKFGLRQIFGDTILILSKYLLISIALFFVAYREKLMLIKVEAINKKHTIICSISGIILFGLFILTKYLTAFRIVDNYMNYLSAIIIVKYIALVSAVILFAIAVYGLDFLKKFIKDFWKEMLLVFVLTIVIYNAVMFIRGAWQFLSKIVTLSVSFLLATVFDEVRYSVANPESPTLAVGDFGVIIGSPCSGIDGMSLFTMLFMMMIAFDWSRVNKVKAFLIFPIGAIGMFCMNIVRVFSLMVVGKTISVDFAIGAFHSNVGWIIFITYFLTFLYFVYPYLVKK